jgi:hypothetical protein
MEFDERMQRTFESLTARLQQEIAGQLSAASAELSASALADRDAALAARDAAVAEAVRETRTAAEHELAERFAGDLARAEAHVRAELTASHTEAHERLIESHKAASEGLIESHKVASEGLIESHKAASERLIESHKAAGERLIEAVRTIDGAHSLSDVLDALVACAGKEVGRAALFLLQEPMLKGWRLAGFNEFGAAGSHVELPVADGGLIAEAAETCRVVRVARGSPRSGVLPAFVNLPDAALALAVPLVMSGQAFAVLYVDEGNNDATARDWWPATIEVLARHAARALEAITAARLAQVSESVSR